MYRSECVNNNEIEFYFPNLETLGERFLAKFSFNNKITFKFPRLKEFGCLCGADINWLTKENTLAELTIECDKTLEKQLFSFFHAQLNKLIAPRCFGCTLSTKNYINEDIFPDE